MSADPGPLLQVTDDELDDLHDRLVRTRWWPTWPDVVGWEAGVPQPVLRRLVERWRHGFDWPAAEASINALPWALADLDEADASTRYLRFDPLGGSDGAILLLNGWPSTFLELVPLARLLAEPPGGGSAYTVVVPVLPGFPGAPQATTLPPDPPVHERWHRLMTGLGLPRYVVHGGDLGAGTATRLAHAHPEAVIGLHLLAVADPVEVDAGSVTSDEQAFLDEVAAWVEAEGSYEHQQQTRPSTLAAGLSDSPVGLLAWLVEKYHAWTDHPADAVSAFDDDLVLTQASLYWFTDSIATSFRPYFEHAQRPVQAVRRIEVPTAVALFPRDLVHPPRSWVERTYDVVRYTRFPRGGHFAALEVPDVLAADLLDFIRHDL